MSTFSIESFAQECETALAAADDKQAVAAKLLKEALQTHETQEIIAALEAAVPPGADIGELIVYASENLTVLYGRMPPRFQSGIHNHTMYACIGPLVGQEKNTVFEPLPFGGLRVDREVTVNPGEVFVLEPDAVHCIENPAESIAQSLHLYGGDLKGAAEHRSLWTADDHAKKAFSFPELLRESVHAMRQAENKVGIEALVEAIPAAASMVD